MGGQNDTKEQHGGNDSQQRQEHGDSGGGSSGHGAASAMERMISQGREHRHHSGEADDAAGAHGS